MVVTDRIGLWPIFAPICFGLLGAICVFTFAFDWSRSGVPDGGSAVLGAIFIALAGAYLVRLWPSAAARLQQPTAAQRLDRLEDEVQALRTRLDRA